MRGTNLTRGVSCETYNDIKSSFSENQNNWWCTESDFDSGSDSDTDEECPYTERKYPGIKLSLIHI